MLTYTLFKTHSMLLSVTSRKSQPDPLHSVQNPEILSSASSRKGSQMLTHQLFKTRAPSSQQQAGIPSQMPTYKLFKIQSMFLSGTSRKGQPDADLQSVQNPEHARVRYKQERPARFCLTSCLNPGHALLRNKQDSPARHLLTSCSKTQSMLLSDTSRKSQPDSALHPVQTQGMLFSETSRTAQPNTYLQAVQNPEYALLSNQQEGPAIC